MGLRFLRRFTFPKKLGLLGKLYGQTLAREGVVWVKTSAGPVWKLDLRNSTHRWIVFGDYEGPGFIRWARRWVRENSVVVDSGANIGQVLLYLAPQIKTGKYLAFEPFPPAREWLRECLSKHPEWPVQIEEFGLGGVYGHGFVGGPMGRGFSRRQSYGAKSWPGRYPDHHPRRVCKDELVEKDSALEVGHGGRGGGCFKRRAKTALRRDDRSAGSGI
jgi:FkbM family methyltransferase